jgi:deazaflavin-dependent oxidoreductase (nitroreductase family)
MTLTPQLVERLISTRTIDLTTFGRRTGLPRRIEIWWFHVEGRFVITGTPGRRDWLANIRADPRVIVHAAGVDIDATATEIGDEGFRRLVFNQPHTRWYSTQSQLEHLVGEAPMVEVVF